MNIKWNYHQQLYEHKLNFMFREYRQSIEHLNISEKDKLEITYAIWNNLEVKLFGLQSLVENNEQPDSVFIKEFYDMTPKVLCLIQVIKYRCRIYIPMEHIIKNHAVKKELIHWKRRFIKWIQSKKNI